MWLVKIYYGFGMCIGYLIFFISGKIDLYIGIGLIIIVDFIYMVILFDLYIWNWKDRVIKFFGYENNYFG